MIDLARRAFRRLYTYSIPRRLSTSLSDNQAYPHVCMRAAHDFRRFNTFRRNPIYNQILEHVSTREGAQYLDEIRKSSNVLRAMEEFKRNDSYGGPRLVDYLGVGAVSPTTLRYVKVLADLERLFGKLDGFRICEVGVGYGGQCRIINAYFRPATYCLVDIRAALELAKRFLDHFIVHSLLSFKPMNELPSAEYDLAISNYSFTELPRSIQDVYLAKAITRAARGYITYNEITPPHFNSYTRAELLELLPGARVLPEIPQTHPRNCIIAWDRSAMEAAPASL